MARVFLSYSREDAASAQRLAEAVADAGHEVWWDRHLHGGSQFASEIDQALAKAEAVVVLWSEASIRSAWVQDEAAEGRDTGRLVPVMLDSSKPPLGFRQFHSIDLSDWNGASEPAALPELLRAIAKNAGKAPPGPAPQTRAAGQHHKLAICVLPFINVSGDAEQEYFSDGITEDIITDLSKISALSVVSRHTAFTFKGKDVDVRSLARQLNVTHVLEGSVRKAGSRVRITAQLIDGEMGDHVWADRYDRDLTDIFAIQDEISKAIVAALELKLLPEEKKQIEKRGTSSVEAYNLYLMARQHWISGNLGDIRRDEAIVRICQQATLVDERYAQAWALMALAQSDLMFWHGKPENPLPAAERAIAIDPTLAEAHCVKAQYLQEEGRQDEANRQMQIALRLDPECWEVNREAAGMMFRQGQIREAAAFFEKATALVSSDYHSPSVLQSCYIALGDEDALLRTAATTLERAEAAISRDPTNVSALADGAFALGTLGERERAKEWANRALLLDPDNMRMRYNLGCAFAVKREVELALDVLEPFFEWIPTVARIQHAEIDPDLDPIRSDPRFQKMLSAAKKRLGLAGTD